MTLSSRTLAAGSKPIRVLPLFLFLLITAFPAVSQATLTLDEAVKRALDNSLNLKRDAIELARREYSANHLWSEIFPAFSLSAGLTFLPSTNLFSEPGFHYNSEALSYNFNFGLSLTLNPSLGASMKIIELAYRTELLNYEEASKQLEIKVIKDFLGIIKNKEYLDYLKESLEIAEQKLAKDSLSRQNGLLSELDFLNSRLNTETARYTLSNATVTYNNSLREFLDLLGMEAGTDIVLLGTLEIAPVVLDPDQLIMEHLVKRPDILSRRQAIERLELTRKVTAYQNRAPTLELGTTWRGGSPASNRKDGFGDPFTDSLSGSLTLRIPVDSWIPGTRQNQAVRNADTEIEKARLDLQNTELQAKTQIRSLIANLRSTWESLEIARLRMEIARRTIEATEEGFNKGTVESRVLDDTRNKLTDAHQQLLQGEFNYQSLLLDLAAALNTDWKTLTRH